MTMLVIATLAFLLTHFVSSTPLRPALVARLGEWPYRGLYTLVAFVTLAWMIWAYAHAPRAMLWSGPRDLPIVVMPVALVLAVAGYWRNPTAVGAEKLLKSDEPARGVIRITRHPLMWAIMLWAAVHVLALGDARAVVFFGGFLVLAALGTILIDRRKRADPNWARFATLTSNVPFVAIVQGRNRIAWREIGWPRPIAGLALFALLLVLHPWLFGVRPY
jgi:uncharacterized membrane protein